MTNQTKNLMRMTNQTKKWQVLFPGDYNDIRLDGSFRRGDHGSYYGRYATRRHSSSQQGDEDSNTEPSTEDDEHGSHDHEHDGWVSLFSGYFASRV